MHDDLDADSFERFQKRWPSAMPAGSEQAKKSARKQTYAGRKAQKRVARTSKNIRNRRRRKYD